MKTFHDVVDENDRIRNLMVFGLVEEDEEVLVEQVEEIFDELGEKPHSQACRIGAKTAEKTRPVKILLSNSVMSQQTLSKSCKLRRTEKYRTFYFAPDRTSIQQEEQKKLVEELRKLVARDPAKRYTIKNGKIVCADKNSN